MKISILSLFLLFSFACLAQDQDKNKAYLLERSKSLKKAAWICLGSGTAAIAAGVIIPRGELVSEAFWFVPAEYENTNIKTALILGGSVATLASFFLFGKSSKFERRAMELSFKNEPGRALVNHRVSATSIPSVSLRFTF